MFCPNCGSNQSNRKKFCTACGTNLSLVSQALTGNLSQPNAAPPFSPSVEIERQRQMARGLRLAIIGGGIVALKFFGFVFSGPFHGSSPFGLLMIIGFILLATGISKIIGSRPPQPPNARLYHNPSLPQPPESVKHPPQPVFFASSYTEAEARKTSEIEIKNQPLSSVTEDETAHLPQYSPAKNVKQ